MLNINKTTAAVAHFTAADDADTDNLFDQIVKHSDEYADTLAAKAVKERYSLTDEEFTLFREMCLKIVDVATTTDVDPYPLVLNMTSISQAFAGIFAANGDARIARQIIDGDIDNWQGLSVDDMTVLRALLIAADEFTDVGHPTFLQDLN